MAKYSIILPVRNGGEYVKECVNSILSQTYPDFNFIILDNCSTDGTLKWLQSLSDDRVKIITSDKSLSIEENWGRILNTEKKEFMTIIGHDDILYPNFLELIDRLVISNPEASLYHTHFNYIDSNGKIIRSCKPMSHHITGYEFLESFLQDAMDSMGTGYVMRSKDYNELHGIPLNYPSLLFADFELWLRLTFKGYEVVTPEKCFAFRIHQSTTANSQDQKLHKALEVFIAFLRMLKEKDEKAAKIINQFAGQFLLFYCKGFSHRMLRTPIKKRENLTVRNFVEHTKNLAASLGIKDQYHPGDLLTIKLAEIIDGNAVLRRSFLLLKKIYNKPILK